MSIDEIPLANGRVTRGVVRKGEYVLRPCCANSPFVHDVLRWLDGKGVSAAPRFIGVAPDGREITSFLEGASPENLGDFNDAQLRAAGKIICTLHGALSDFPGCLPGQTVCHNDLSPCNFMFQNGLPYAAFDWDAACIGNPLGDIAYAAWMWCDIGNAENTPLGVGHKIKALLDAYGLPHEMRSHLIEHMYAQMRRVAASAFAVHTPEWDACGQWAEACEQWLHIHQKEIAIPFSA
jgi:Ser/Thr protein kinase RdoA (MazF antagonist)